MGRAGSFTISCPTKVFFGEAASKDLCSCLPNGAKSVAVITGASGIAAVSVLRILRQSGLAITQIKCAAEPSVPAINSALELLDGKRCDAVIACGGGSVIDTGKLITFLVSHQLKMSDDFDEYDSGILSVPSTMPFVAMPTTAGTGAEVTANAVVFVPSKGEKISLRGRALNPAVAIVDPLLMKTGPAHVVLRSGLDAITQVIEAYTSAFATPFTDGLTIASVEKGLRGLRGTMGDNTPESWVDMAWVSLASGLALANGGLGAAHGMAAVVGGRYDAPHGAVCGRLIIPVLRRNLAVSTVGSVSHSRHVECATIIAKVFPPKEGLDQLSGFEAWMRFKNLPRLSDWGVRPEAFEDLANAAVGASSSKKNAVPLTKLDFLRILEDAL